MSMILDGSNGVTFNDSSLQGSAASPYVLKNRIINGDMRIDQRNAGSAVTVNTASNTYGVDRFFGYGQPTAGVFTIQQSTTAPTGFKNSTKITVTTADASLGTIKVYAFCQSIEGFNTADLNFGSSSASTITLSFWIQASVTGTYSATLFNNAFNRGYTASFTINSANTWQQVSLTITGDTTGTWTTDNTTGIRLWIALGTGSTYKGASGSWNAGTTYGVTGQVDLISTLSATMYITGVQLEIGTSATPFERRLYNQELANCQRYYQTSFDINTAPSSNSSQLGEISSAGVSAGFSTNLYCSFTFQVKMRSAPTVNIYNTRNVVAGNSVHIYYSGGSGIDSSALNFNDINQTSVSIQPSSSSLSGQIQGLICCGYSSSAEL